MTSITAASDEKATFSTVDQPNVTFLAEHVKMKQLFSSHKTPRNVMWLPTDPLVSTSTVYYKARMIGMRNMPLNSGSGCLY